MALESNLTPSPVRTVSSTAASIAAPYQGNNEGIITFDWSEDEWQKMNQTLIVKISLTDELKNQVKIFRIKTSTLK